MIMQKNDSKTEAGEPPPMELLHQVRAFIGEYAKDGRFIDGEGLLGSKHRTRLTFRSGHATVKHGPYKGEHELPTATLLLKVKTRDEALRWAERYGKILGDGEIELAKLIEPWDVGMTPTPENPALRFLLIDKADAASEGAGRSAKQKSDITRLKTEMTKAGVLEGSWKLEPSCNAKRLFFTDHKPRVVDGPFAESKELLGGFLLMELSTVDEAIEVCQRYAAVHAGILELDLREVDTTPDAARGHEEDSPKIDR
jgi:hypothetical protein